MNDNRFGRATYKNLLSNMGSTLIGHQATQPQNGDENYINAKTNPKSNISSSSSTAQLQSIGQHVDLKQSQSYSAQLNALQSARNALGDIGNRIGLSNVPFGALKKDASNALKPIVHQQIEIKEEKCVVTKSSTTTIHIQETKKETIVHNNSCVMEEIDGQQDELIDVELEQEEPVLDIDKQDAANPQLASEYVKEVYAYLSQLEKEFRIQPNFLENKIVTSKMRSVLIDWLIQVHLKFQLLQETLYLCIWIIDAYLMAVDVPKMQLQLVGVTAMFLASKYEEMYVPAIDDFVYMTDNTYTKHEIRQMEISILKTLNFLLCKPLPLHFLRRFSKAGQADPKHHTLAKYFMELSLHDAEFSSMDPSYLAACSLNLSFKLLNGPKWNRTLEHYSNYKQQVLLAGMQKIAKLVLKSMSLDYKYRAATNKYGASKYMRISFLTELSSNLMKELDAGNFSAMQ